jgi:hypothetical protein
LDAYKRKRPNDPSANQNILEFMSTPDNDFHWQYGNLASALVSNPIAG